MHLHLTHMSAYTLTYTQTQISVSYTLVQSESREMLHYSLFFFVFQLVFELHYECIDLILNWNRTKPTTWLVITMVKKRPIKPDPVSAGKSVTHVCCLLYQLSKVGEKPACVTVMRLQMLLSLLVALLWDQLWSHFTPFKTEGICVGITDWRSVQSGRRMEDWRSITLHPLQ